MGKLRFLALTTVLAFILFGCGVGGGPSVSGGVRTVVDQAGRSVEVKYPAERIISGYYISSSACIALGIADKMVGIEARANTRPIYALAAPGLLELPNVGSASEFNLEACVALEPDLVILPRRLSGSADILSEMGISVILVNPEGYAELTEMITLIGDLTGAADRAARLVEYFENTRADISALTSGLTERPSVYMCGVGSYLTTAAKDMHQAAMINMSGGRNAAESIEGSGWTEISYEQLLAMNPDVMIIPSEAGYGRDDILGDSQLASLAAVRNDMVYKMPGGLEAWDSPVPSCILGTQWLLGVLHGDLYSPETLQKDAADFYNEFYGFQIDAIPLIVK